MYWRTCSVMAPQVGFEPTTRCLEERGCVGAYLKGVPRHEAGRKSAFVCCKAGYRILRVYGASLPDSNIRARQAIIASWWNFFTAADCFPAYSSEALIIGHK